MSLTSHLGAPASPVRLWFEDHFTQTRQLLLNANDHLCGKPRGPCVVPLAPGSDAGLVGTAVDYLLRATLAPDALEDTVATNGALYADVLLKKSVATPLEREAVAAIARLEPSSHSISEESLRSLARLCLVLARLDQLVRAGERVYDYAVTPLHDAPSLDTYADRIIPPASLDDLCALAATAIPDHADLKDAQPLILNPTFTQSHPLGGADADLIAGDDLRDFKATARTSGAKREDIWQLIGYVLADTIDQYGIRCVSLDFLRRRKTVSWTLRQLLSDLTGGMDRPLADWRAEFAEIVASAKEDPDPRD